MAQRISIGFQASPPLGLRVSDEELRNRIVVRAVRVVRRWRYRWTVVRPVERPQET